MIATYSEDILYADTGFIALWIAVIFMHCYPFMSREFQLNRAFVIAVGSQVRLFAAEDAPDSSGTARQDLLQAKQTKFMHATVPISSNALPPGFTPTATMGTKPAVGAVLPQVPWRVPTLVSDCPLSTPGALL
jgi:hypothetical protein